ncbi:MAG TPA: FliH/SctL family protein [Acidobacteriaceae bacterium]|jgi:flagellar assembly protein FliH|nr:FliH/SctL family protein [Acidobacteriaceae bacterium]
MSSNPEFNGAFTLPIASLQYRDIAGHPLNGSGTGADADAHSGHKASRGAEVEMTEAEFSARILRERAEATAQAEQRLRQEYEQKLVAARSTVSAALVQFAEARNTYFVHVESEVVQLSLSIAAKILHREAQVDPMLVATLVRMAIERMRDDSIVTVRVHPARVASWKQYFAADPAMAHVAVEEDAQLTDQDCVLETELGSANFGLDSQLKEIQQGFFDLLALRPTTR